MNVLMYSIVEMLTDTLQQKKEGFCLEIEALVLDYVEEGMEIIS